MNINQFKKQFPNENVCRQFFESVIWANGRICPHCRCPKSFALKSTSVKTGTYECAKCKRQFTVTPKTPMHSTKLKFWTWLQAIYFIINSSKGISSVVLARWVGVSQPTAWKMGHAIRQMMIPTDEGFSLTGMVELDEKYFGGKPRYQPGVVHKRGRGTSKQ
jgi:transposase-like protein